MTTKAKNPRSGAAHSGPDAPPPRPPGASPGPPDDGPTAAVWAALTANPGATAAQIAAAARTSRAVTSRELAALQSAGRATRTPGPRSSRGPAPATWHPAVPGEPSQPAAGAPGTGSPSAGDVSAASEGAPETAGAATADAAGPSAATTSEADSAAGGMADTGDPGGTAASGGAAGTGPGVNPAGDSEVPRQVRPGDSAEHDSGTDSADEVELPAACGDAAQLLEELAAAASRAASILRDGQIAVALKAMEEISGTAAHARRLARSAVSGRRTRSGTTARPGQLRDLVAGHLAAYPDAEFTPHAIGRVLGRSSGAVANALDRLTALGQAQLTSDHPRRYKAAQTAHSYLAA